MRAFGYWRDPATLLAVSLYVLNQVCFKHWVHGGFLHHHFNDVLLIPAALPLVLWLHRRLGWRSHDAAPTLAEIAGHLIAWTVVCEIVTPLVTAHATGDWRDAVAYAAGALAAAAWWRWPTAAARRVTAG